MIDINKNNNISVSLLLLTAMENPMYLFSVSKRDRNRGFFSKLIFCIALLVMAATEANAVSYTGFNDKTYELTPWEGANVVVLTQSNTLDVSTMRNIVENLDGAWDVYEDLTGRSPTPWPATTLNGRSTIAELPDGETCGAGCAYLGFTGIEIQSTYWNILYDGVMSANEYDQVLFYELGRNFWLYNEQLGTIEPFVTGFAIANRFVSMNEVDVAGGPFGSHTFDEFKRLATEELFAAYLADPSLDWRNTLAANSGVPGQVFSGAADLAGAMLYQIYEDHGYAGYRAFWRELNDQPQATTSDDAMVNFIYAAYLGTGQDYRPLMKADDLPAPVPPTRIETLWIPIAIGSDDAEENLNDGDVSLTSSDLEFIQDGLKPQLVGLRFPLDIPAGATILTANIQFTADETSSTSTVLLVSAEKTTDALPFRDLKFDISTRPLTAASIPWTPPEWTLKGEAGPDQQTPDLSPIVQEIVNKIGWTQGNSIAFITSGSGKRVAESFNGTAAPILHVEFSTLPPAPVAPVAVDDGLANSAAYTTGINQELMVADGAGDIVERNDAVGFPVAVVTTFGPVTGLENEVGTLGTSAAEGVVIVYADGSFNYTPAVGYLGPDSFYYRLSNTEGDSYARVYINVVDVTTLWISLENDLDDAEENTSNGDMYLASSDLELIQDGSSNQLVGLRFALDIPLGATIEEAYIQYTTDEKTSELTVLKMHGEATTNALAFSDKDFNISNRTLTAAHVDWTPPPWTTIGETGLDQATPDLSTIVQEVVSQVDWVQGNSIVFITSGNGKRVAESFNGSAPPVLHVSFSTETTKLSFPVQMGSDDAEQDVTSGEMDLGSSDLEMIRDKSSIQLVGVRFQGVNIPEGAQIEEAYIQYTVDEVTTEKTVLTVFGEASVNASTFNETAFNIANRPATTASVEWMPPVWKVKGLGGPGQRTPDLSAIIQEIVEQPNWAAGNALVIMTSGSGNRVAESFNGTAAPELHLVYSVPTPLWIPVITGSDDAEQDVTSGEMDLGSSDLEMIRDKSSTQLVGVRFQGVNIPEGAQIEEAYIQYTVDEVTTEKTILTVIGEASDNAPTFNEEAFNIANRPTTTASVEWMPPVWKVKGLAGPGQRTPDLSAIVQEIVEQPGWAAGNALVIMTSGSGNRVAESFNGTAAPELHLVYSVPPAVTYAIGDTGPGGGIVFHVTDGGLHGFEAALVNQASARWCFNSIDIAGVDNIRFQATLDSNSGADNTALIVAVCGPNSAAGVAANYVWPNGQTDGFLPNKEELNLLFNQRNVVGGFATGDYWSSSEKDSSSAWSSYTGDDDGFQSSVGKSETIKVRAVRSFSAGEAANIAPSASNVLIIDANGAPANVGDTLMGSYIYSDENNDPEGTSTFRWLRNGTTVVATMQNYIPVAADEGATLTFEVTPVATIGATPGVAVVSEGVMVEAVGVTYAIGDTGPGGGIVFHVTDGGLYGLEAARVNQATLAPWCLIFSDIAGVDNISSRSAPDSNSGAHNTPLIEAVCGPNSAAGVAANYVWPNGQTDGFLPNKQELSLLFNQRNVVGGFDTGDYWSSSENVSIFAAYLQYFSEDLQFHEHKAQRARVRAVRFF